MAHPHLTRLTTYNIEDSNIALLGSEVSDPLIWPRRFTQPPLAREAREGARRRL
jgi:hypothetical protein